MKAFILAAGKGERLLPYTKFLPKPLFPIVGTPILEIHLKKFLNLGINNIGINVYHLKEKILEFLNKFSQKSRINITVFEEEKLLGTGGGIFNAKQFFTTTTLIVNADIMHDFPLEFLIEYHQRNKGLATMVCIPHFLKNVKVDLLTNTIISFRSKDSNFFYTGIQIIEPELFEMIPPKSDLIDSYIEGLAKGLKISALVVKDYNFIDIGTLPNYLLVHEMVLLKKIKIEGLNELESPFIIKTKNSGSKRIVCKDWVYIDEDCKFLGNATLSKVIAWKGATIPEGIHEGKLFI